MHDDRIAEHLALGIDLLPLYRDLGKISQAYYDATEAVRAATRTFEAVRQAFRAGQIDAATFLTAQDQYLKAQADFDVAYLAEQKGSR